MKMAAIAAPILILVVVVVTPLLFSKPALSLLGHTGLIMVMALFVTHLALSAVTVL